MPGTQPANTYPLGTPVQRTAPIVADDPYFRKLSSDWSLALRSAFTKIEELDF